METYYYLFRTPYVHPYNASAFYSNPVVTDLPNTLIRCLNGDKRRTDILMVLASYSHDNTPCIRTMLLIYLLLFLLSETFELTFSATIILGSRISDTNNNQQQRIDNNNDRLYLLKSSSTMICVNLPFFLLSHYSECFLVFVYDTFYIIFFILFVFILYN